MLSRIVLGLRLLKDLENAVPHSNGVPQSLHAGSETLELIMTITDSTI